ncbi:MAG: radical SAM protein [Alphaproteobacteria bacterium]|nr:MAG: radical SAM protein [Alphaproteobacteria bacterium]
MPHIQLVVIQPTPFCNIDCRYCYLPDRSNKAVVSEETLGNFFSQIFASGWLRDGLSVVWHAGEPMVLPIDFYRRAFRLIDSMKPPDVALTHAFQTNGTLIDDAWCAFFAEETVNVGVSVDGPQRLHDINRRTRAGSGTFDKTIAGIRRLRERGIPFHVISVLSAESLAAPREMFDFYIAEGIDRICFNVEESEGGHVSRSFGESGIEGAYYRFDPFGAAPDGGHVFQSAGRPLCGHQHGLGRQHRDLFAGAARAEKRRLRRFHPRQHQSRPADRYGARARADQTASGYRCRGRDVPARLRVLQHLRRRRAGQQAGGERQLRQHGNDLLPDDQNAGHRSRARSAGFARAAWTRTFGCRHSQFGRRASRGRSEDPRCAGGLTRANGPRTRCST